MEIALFSQCNIFSLRFHFHPFFVRFFSVSCFPSECGLLRRPIRSAGAAACVGVAMQARYRAIGAADVGPTPWGSLATYDTRVKQISKKKKCLSMTRCWTHLHRAKSRGGVDFWRTFWQALWHIDWTLPASRWSPPFSDFSRIFLVSCPWRVPFN